MVYRQKGIMDKIFEWAGEWRGCWMKGAQQWLADNTGSKMGDGFCRSPSPLRRQKPWLRQLRLLPPALFVILWNMKGMV